MSVFPERHGWIPLLAFGTLGVGAWLWNADAFISDDSYFYAVVARNLALEGSQSFNGVISTNGVHPLWLYLLAAYSTIVAQWNASLLWEPAYAVPLSAALLAWGTVATWRLARALHVHAPTVAGLTLVFFACLGVLYSEAHLYFAALATLFLVLAAGGVEARGGVWRVALAAACVFLARLDSVFVLAASLGAHLLTTPRPRRVIAAAILAAIPALLYVASNASYFGGLVPVSGWMKSTFPSLAVRETLFQGASQFMGNSIPFGIAPLVAGAGALAWRPRLRDPRWLWLGSLWVGAFLQSLYIALFTRGHTGWHWYYVPHVLLAALLVGALVPRISIQRRVPDLVAVGILALGVVLLLHQSMSSGTSRVQRAVIAFVESRGIADATILMSDWPGHVAFHTTNRIVSIDMLMANRRFYEAMAAAPEPMAHLEETFREAGHPIEYLLWDGSRRFTVSEDRRHVAFHDPRSMPMLAPFGEMTLPQGPIQSDAGDGLVVWKLAP